MEFVRRACPRAVCERKEAASLEAGIYYAVFHKPSGDRLGMGQTPTDAWKAAEQILRGARYFADPRGGMLMMRDGETPSDPMLQEITAAEFYSRM